MSFKHSQLNAKCINLTVESKRSCPIIIGHSILSKLHDCIPDDPKRKIAIISNQTVASIYLNPLKTALSKDHDVIYLEVNDSEKSKDFMTVSNLLDQLLNEKLERNDIIIALGGGVIGDLAGFVASIYLRGIQLIQIPTSLLSQVDSSVGGKTGVNHKSGKNLIGTFYQPHMTFIDIQALNTLDKRQCLCGLAEIIKYGIILDKDFFDFIDKNKERIKNFNFSKDKELWEKLIHTSCANKAKVVEKDEKEAGLRAILNLGHTFAHAIESVYEYGTYCHGEAVAIGMVAATKLAEKLKIISTVESDKIVTLIHYFDFPKRTKPVDSQLLIDKMKMDKKVKSGSIQFILPTAIGKVISLGDIDENEVKNILRNVVIE
ncbi:3-dehydroquinate synthase [Candidatus Marinamargulisbacteria bacterium SCGC AAA071-K20]|nr:3-dehydroquinate synthase [Candidatus Marinamargulisbacteria bacterium SCGC AAA071-K20]